MVDDERSGPITGGDRIDPIQSNQPLVRCLKTKEGPMPVARAGTGALALGLVVWVGFGLSSHAKEGKEKEPSGTGQACLLEGMIVFGGVKTEVKDCIENRGAPEGLFATMCHDLANAGKPLGQTPPKVTFMASCPTPAQGSCEGGTFASHLKFFYYARDPEALSDTQAGCEASGGIWK